MKHKVTHIFLPLLAWFVTILSLNLTGAFRQNPQSPPLALLLSVIGPPLLFGLWYGSSTSFRETISRLNLVFLTATQAWRVAGVMFLVLYVYDLLPGSFAWPAGAGDLLVGLYAPFVVVMIVTRRAGWKKHAFALNILGLLDFVGAVGSGILSGGTPLGILVRDGVTSDLMQQLPLALIPTFFVPFWIVIHICSLILLRKGNNKKFGK